MQAVHAVPTLKKNTFINKTIMNVYVVEKKYQLRKGMTRRERTVEATATKKQPTERFSKSN